MKLSVEIFHQGGDIGFVTTERKRCHHGVDGGARGGPNAKAERFAPTDDTRVGFDANQQDFHRAIKPRELWAWSVDFKR